MYDSSNQVVLGSNSDSVYYNLTPDDCQSERVSNLIVISYISANEIMSVATCLEIVG